jgi:hypothetical protein
MRSSYRSRSLGIGSDSTVRRADAAAAGVAGHWNRKCVLLMGILQRPLETSPNLYPEYRHGTLVSPFEVSARLR